MMMNTSGYDVNIKLRPLQLQIMKLISKNISRGCVKKLEFPEGSGVYLKFRVWKFFRGGEVIWKITSVGVLIFSGTTQ